MELLNTKAAQIVAGVLALGILSIGAVVWLRFGGYLGWLLVVEVTALVLVGNLALTVGILRWHRRPIVVYDKHERQVRMVDGAVLDPPLFPNLTTYHGPIDRSSTAAPALLPPAIDRLPHAEPFSRIVRELRPDHLILGYNLAGAVVGTLDDLLSTAIIGRPGTGKTTALRYIFASVLAIGGDAMLLDPHGSIAEDVANLIAIGEDAEGMARIAYRLDQHLTRRLELRRAKQPTGAPILLIADEWPLISHLSQSAIETAGRVILEGRKVNMFALISAQGLPSDHLGGSYIRDSLSSRYIFNVTSRQAGMVGLEMSDDHKALLAQLATAGAGYAILASAKRAAEVVAIPQTTGDDLRALLGWLPPLPPNPNRVSLAPQEPHNSPPAPLSERERERETILAFHDQGHKPYVIARMMGKAGAYAEVVKRVLAEEESS